MKNQRRKNQGVELMRFWLTVLMLYLFSFAVLLHAYLTAEEDPHDRFRQPRPLSATPKRRGVHPNQRAPELLLGERHQIRLESGTKKSQRH